MIKETHFMADGYFKAVTLVYSEKTIKVSFRFNRALIDEIKAMEGASWDKDNKTWRISNSPRNAWSIAYLEGKNPYKRYEQPYMDIKMSRPGYSHQEEGFRWMMTVKRGILAYEMGLGKTLMGIEVMEAVGDEWWWVGPKRPVEAVALELRKWDCKNRPELMTYEGFVKKIENWPSGKKGPKGIIFDEAQKLKTPGSKRTKTALHASGYLDYVFLLTGTPAPKSPLDWWTLCEIAQPGFLRESNHHKFHRRLALMETVSLEAGSSFPRLVTWWDNPQKCGVCGQFQDYYKHDLQAMEALGEPGHEYKESVNEIEKLYKRMKGLVLIRFKKDCLDLPKKQYRVVECEPDKKFEHYVKLFKNKAKTALEKLTWMRELSDGFIYKDDGSYMRITSPKEDALKELLEEFEDYNRIVVFAGFQGSVDICDEICRKAGWNTIKLDGRGVVMPYEGDFQEIFLSDKPDKIAFVSQPDSGGVGLNLQTSPAVIFYSNSFKGESRMQAEDRIHRPGMVGANIIDIFCLPTDKYVFDNLQKKRDMQSVTMGEINAAMEHLDRRLF